MSEEKVKDVMSKNVITIDANNKILDAAREMNAKNIGCLVVTEKEAIVGIITEQDLARRVVSTGIDPKKTSIKRIMTRSVKTISPEQNMEEAISIMRANKIKHLPVVHHGKVKGVISSRDVIGRLKTDKYFLLSWKKSSTIAALWLFSIFAHNVLTALLGLKDTLFFVLAVIIIPGYFILALTYTILTQFIRAS